MINHVMFPQTMSHAWIAPMQSIQAPFVNLAWRADWACGLALIVLTVVIHVLGLGLIGLGVVRVCSVTTASRHPIFEFMIVSGCATLLASMLHGIEVAIWAIAYLFLGALPDFKFAMLYSLNAVTSYGHDTLVLEGRWQLMGALEALNGWLLFGLTTAFLFGMMQRFWLSDDGERRFRL
jgi:hypothetical protein